MLIQVLSGRGLSSISINGFCIVMVLNIIFYVFFSPSVKVPEPQLLLFPNHIVVLLSSRKILKTKNLVSVAEPRSPAVIPFFFYETKIYL
jgi:hypothetical protein